MQAAHVVIRQSDAIVCNMANPTSLESSVKQFYQSLDDDEICLQPRRYPTSKVQQHQRRPQTAIDDLAGIQGFLQSKILGESIRNDLDIDLGQDAFASFFQDLSGWDSDKALILTDGSCLQYLNYYDKKDELIDSANQPSAKKAKSRRKSLAIRDLLISAKKPSSASTIGYRSKNEWGSEEDSRPYALDIPSDENKYSLIIEPANEPLLHCQNRSSRCGSRESEIQDLDQTLNQLIEATATMTVQKLESKKLSRCGKRAVSGSIRPKCNLSIGLGAKEIKRDPMYITGQKYHTSETSLGHSTSTIPPTSLPKIHNQYKKTCVATNPPDDKKDLVLNNNNADKKDHGIEIPKWYNDSASLKSSHDQNLIRFMEIMGIKSKLRTPRKLSTNGFLSLPMPNQPPETRGLVFENKRGLHSVIDEIIQDDSFKVEALKVPIISNKRTFAEEVQLNREGKSSRKLNH